MRYVSSLRKKYVEEREYISPKFGVAKKDGTSMRLVFDLRKLNNFGVNCSKTAFLSIKIMGGNSSAQKM